MQPVGRKQYTIEIQILIIILLSDVKITFIFNDKLHYYEDDGTNIWIKYYYTVV